MDAFAQIAREGRAYTSFCFAHFTIDLCVSVFAFRVCAAHFLILGNTMIIPANANDVSSMVAQALGVYKNLGVGQRASPHPSKNQASRKFTTGSDSSENAVVDGGYEPSIPDGVNVFPESK